MKRRTSYQKATLAERTAAVKAKVQEEPKPARTTYGAELLISTLEGEAVERRQTAKELAFAIGIHPAHWYRLRAAPRLLARCERPTLESIASYLRWPLGRVLLACGVVEFAEFEVFLGGRDVVTAAIAQIERSALGSSLVTPLGHAARDHQTLLAELYLALQAEKVKGQRSQAGASSI